MKNSKSHIEEMHAKLADVSNREGLLIAALGEALSLADKKLLDDVRSLTIEHETRRGLILSELQNLAARIGAFPISEDCEDSISTQGHLDLPYYETGEAPHEPDDEACKVDMSAMDGPRGGDWRQAAMNIRDELGFHLNGRKVSAG
ncbi:MAG: hypothetical protein APF80_02485 [Alphaproteobacteria bacterium BRH_c36]|nr:MAG: hypothetical protein APF80_02485 [Alphaproteobacteria bacterium BRH_c36]